MPGEAFHGIDLTGNFVKLVYDISEKIAAGSEHAISYVRSNFLSGLKILFEKVKISRFKV